MPQEKKNLNDLKNDLKIRIEDLKFLPKIQQDHLFEMNSGCKSEDEFKAVRMLVGIIEKVFEIKDARSASEILKSSCYHKRLCRFVMRCEKIVFKR